MAVNEVLLLNDLCLVYVGICVMGLIINKRKKLWYNGMLYFCSVCCYIHNCHPLVLISKTGEDP